MCPVKFFYKMKNICNNLSPLQKIKYCRLANFLPWIAFGSFTLLFLQACTPPSVYHAHLKYEPTGASRMMEKVGPDFLMTVALFNDIRITDNKSQLGSVTTMNGSIVSIFPEYMKVSESIAMNTREFLFLTGYRISNDVPIWDLSEQTINKSWGKILVGGNIDQLEITCEESFPVKTYQTKLKLTFVFADVQKKKIFYRSSIENSASLEEASFSEKILDQQISKVFSEALDKMLSDTEMRKKMTDTLKIKNKH